MDVKLISVLELFFCARTVQSIFAWNFNSLVLFSLVHMTLGNVIQQHSVGPSCIPDKCSYYYMNIWPEVLCQDILKLGSATFYHYCSTMLFDHYTSQVRVKYISVIPYSYFDVVCTVHHPTICIWTNKIHKTLVIRLYFLLDALHVSVYISPSSGATL